MSATGMGSNASRPLQAGAHVGAPSRRRRNHLLPWLCVLACLAGGGRGLAQIRFEDASQAAGIALLPRSRHPDPKIASSRRDFENVSAPGYFREVRDIAFVDANGDGRLAVRILRGKDKGELWQVDGRRMEILRSLTMEGAFAFGEPGGKSCVSQDGYAAVLWPGKMCGWRKQERNTP